MFGKLHKHIFMSLGLLNSFILNYPLKTKMTCEIFVFVILEAT